MSSEFRLVAPVEEQANPDKVKGLLSTLRFASFVRPVNDEPNRKSLGLDEPRWVIHLDQGSIHYRLRLGGKAPAPAGASYLEVTGENAPGKGVFVVRQGLVDQLSVTLEDFRSHELAAIGKDSLSQLRFVHGRTQWALQNDQGRWRFAGMLGDHLADRDGVDRFFLQLARIKFEKFLPLAQAQAAQTQAAQGTAVAELTLTPKDPAAKPIRLQLGAACPGQEEWVVAVRAAPDSVSGCVSGSLSEDLQAAAALSVEQHLFALHADEVEAMTLKRGEASLALLRSATGYRMTSPAQGDADRVLVDERLQSWLDLAGEVLPAEAAHKFEASTSLIFQGVSDIPERYREQSVEFGPLETGKPVIARRQVDGALVQLPRLI